MTTSISNITLTSNINLHLPTIPKYNRTNKIKQPHNTNRVEKNHIKKYYYPRLKKKLIF